LFIYTVFAAMIMKHSNSLMEMFCRINTDVVWTSTVWALLPL